MIQPRDNVWLNRFAYALAGATVFLLALGGVVTTKGVGMAVPDWPTTYGDHMFLFPPSKWMAGVWDEHVHRLWASLVGLLTAILAIWVWSRDTKGKARWIGIAGMVATLGLMGVRTPMMFVGMAVVCFLVIIFATVRTITDSANRLRWLAVIAFAAVIIQGVLGGLRVLLDDKGWGTELGIFHAAFAQLFLLLIGSVILITSKWWVNASKVPAGISSLRRVVLITTSLIFLQLIFGATMRHQHAGLAVPDLPLAYGKLWPATDPTAIATYNQQRLEANGEQPITAAHVVIHMLHRYTAILIAALIIVSAALAFRLAPSGALVRRFAAIWVGLVLSQLTLGILTITSDRKVDVTTAHVALGALTFLVGWISFLISSRTTAEAKSVAANEILSSKGSELKHA